MRTKKSITFILITFICCYSSCFFELEKEVAVSVQETCNCYSSFKSKSIDVNLDECIQETIGLITNFVDEANLDDSLNVEMQTDFLHEIITEMSKQCELYRNDFVRLNISKFIITDEEVANNYIRDYLKNGISSNINYGEIISSYYSLGEKLKAYELLAESKKGMPKSNYLLWMESVYTKLENDDTKALNSINKAIDLTNDDQLKYALELYRNSISKIDTSTEMVYVFLRKKVI